MHGRLAGRQPRSKPRPHSGRPSPAGRRQPAAARRDAARCRAGSLAAHPRSGERSCPRRRHRRRSRRFRSRAFRLGVTARTASGGASPFEPPPHTRIHHISRVASLRSFSSLPGATCPHAQVRGGDCPPPSGPQSMRSRSGVTAVTPSPLRARTATSRRVESSCRVHV